MSLLLYRNNFCSCFHEGAEASIKVQTEWTERLDSAVRGHILMLAVEKKRSNPVVTGPGSTAASPQSRTKTRKPMSLRVLKQKVNQFDCWCSMALVENLEQTFYLSAVVFDGAGKLHTVVSICTTQSIN